MRELKFRALIKGKNIIRPVAYLKFSDDNELMMAGVFNNNHEISEFIPEDVAIDQSTGLKDKNGIEVYSGDIVERVSLGSSKQVVTGEILFDEKKGAFVWRVYEQGQRGFVDYYLNELAIEKTSKVISNIQTKHAQTLLR